MKDECTVWSFECSMERHWCCVMLRVYWVVLGVCCVMLRGVARCCVNVVYDACELRVLRVHTSACAGDTVCAGAGDDGVWLDV